jgi:hypothetical protein
LADGCGTVLAVKGFRQEKQVIESKSSHSGPGSTLRECNSQSEAYCGGGDRTQLKPVASRIPHNRFQTVLMNVRPLKRRMTSSSRMLLTNVLAARGGIARVRFLGQGNPDRRERPGRRGVDPNTVARNQAHSSAASRPRAAIHASDCGPSSRTTSSKVCRRFQAAEPRANRSRARAR